MITDPLILSIILIFIMFVFLLSSLWIGVSLILTGIIGMLLFDHNLPPVISIYDKIGDLLASSLYDAMNSWSLAALPMFILMGEILYKSSISNRLLNGLKPWLSYVPGELLHVNVAACSLFAAVSGSSAATTATVGKITLEELKKRGYSKKIAIGSLAGAGTLGFLIPPSLIMIIYGVMSDVSIGKLFLAGLIPGVLMASLYSFYIMYRAKVDSSVTPNEKEKYSFKDKINSLKDLAPISSLIILVLGSIYGGFATPTEAAALGVLGSVLLAIYFKAFSFEVFNNALLNTVKTSVMIGFIIAGAVFLSQVIGFLGIARAMSEYITGLGLSPLLLILIIGLMYIVLGMILEAISIVVMTLPIVLPIIVLAGFDPLWFGVFLVFMVEMAQITPPVGFSLFVIQSISGEKIQTILSATLPFFILMIVTVVIITFFPDIVFYLPNKMID